LKLQGKAVAEFCGRKFSIYYVQRFQLFPDERTVKMTRPSQEELDQRKVNISLEDFEVSNNAHYF